MDNKISPVLVDQKQNFQSFEAFWPFYLGEHRNLWNRRLHFVGTCAGLLLLLMGLILGIWAAVIAAPFTGYLFAWFGHFLIEKNRPATFQYPFWSFRGDFKMFYLILIGQIDAEIAVHRGHAPRLQRGVEHEKT